MIVGLVAAIAAATCYGFGSILQAIAASESDASGHLDVAGLARMISHWRYVAGLALDGLGFLATATALQTLPLFVVEAAVASSVGVTAAGAVLLLGVHLARRERQALVALVVGLGLLGVTGRPEEAKHLAEPGPLLLLASAGVLAIVAVVITRTSGERVSAWLAAIAGAAFGGVGIAARALEIPHPITHVLGDPLLYAIGAHGVLGTLLYAAALQRGRVTTVAAITFVVETVVPAAVGLTLLGDRARPGTMPIAVLGFAMSVLASIALARYADPAVTDCPERAGPQRRGG